MCRRIKRFYWPLGLMFLMFLLSSIPGEIKNPQFQFLIEIKPQWQNMLHIPLYALLQFLWLRSLVDGKRGTIKYIVLCCVITLSYGLLDECHQMFVVGRFASVLDVGLNIIGTLGATLLYWLFKVNRSS